MRTARIIFAVISMLCIVKFPSLAAVPGCINYQGKLLDSQEKPVTGSVNMQFSIYDVATGGAPLWRQPMSGTQSVSVKDGLFSVVLGSNMSIPDNVFAGDSYLEVTIGGTALPRTRLISVPYALRARTTEGIALPFFAASANSGTLFSIKNGGGGVALTGESNSGIGVSGISSGTGGICAGVMGQGAYVGVWGTATQSSSYGMVAVNDYGGFGLYTRSIGGTALMVDGTSSFKSNVAITGDLSVSGKINPIIRYVPITAGDMMTTATANSNMDYRNGIIFPHGQQSGGQITFPLPADYDPGTGFSLDLYAVPQAAGTGNFKFFVRWIGHNAGEGDSTGMPYNSPAVTVGMDYYIHKQSFSLPGFSGALPEFIELTIRRDPSDTYPNSIALLALRLSYHATR